ncbi:hypothetical protein CWI36_2321p0010, partial [Hamiltosporidium magnivora]
MPSNFIHPTQIYKKNKKHYTSHTFITHTTTHNLPFTPTHIFPPYILTIINSTLSIYNIDTHLTYNIPFTSVPINCTIVTNTHIYQYPLLLVITPYTLYIYSLSDTPLFVTNCSVNIPTDKRNLEKKNKEKDLEDRYDSIRGDSRRCEEYDTEYENTSNTDINTNNTNTSNTNTNNTNTSNTNTNNTNNTISNTTFGFPYLLIDNTLYYIRIKNAFFSPLKVSLIPYNYSKLYFIFPFLLNSPKILHFSAYDSYLVILTIQHIQLFKERVNICTITPRRKDYKAIGIIGDLEEDILVICALNDGSRDIYSTRCYIRSIPPPLYHPSDSYDKNCSNNRIYSIPPSLYPSSDLYDKNSSTNPTSSIPPPLYPSSDVYDKITTFFSYSDISYVNNTEYPNPSLTLKRCIKTNSKISLIPVFIRYSNNSVIISYLKENQLYNYDINQPIENYQIFNTSSNIKNIFIKNNIKYFNNTSITTPYCTTSTTLYILTGNKLYIYNRVPLHKYLLQSKPEELYLLSNAYTHKELQLCYLTLISEKEDVSGIQHYFSDVRVSYSTLISEKEDVSGIQHYFSD